MVRAAVKDVGTEGRCSEGRSIIHSTSVYRNVFPTLIASHYSPSEPSQLTRRQMNPVNVPSRGRKYANAQKNIHVSVQLSSVNIP